MAELAVAERQEIPCQVSVPWNVVFSVSWSSLRRRFFRSLITMLGVILAIAFLTYMMVQDSVVDALLEARIEALNLLLQKSGVDVLAVQGTDTMMILLISLALLTCLVGIVNAMFMSVSERIKEIGTLKCLGAEDSFIVKTYFVESSLQGVLGTTLGILIGLVVSVALCVGSYGGYVFQYFPYGAVLRAIAIALAIGSIISVLASIGPAYWASKKQPVDAMRVEE
ncbi:MAG: ABC transporter permease [Lentisphaerae bacterium]|nr:ABC transporter permease [Lentisphaerota bacterium]